MTRISNLISPIFSLLMAVVIGAANFTPGLAVSPTQPANIALAPSTLYIATTGNDANSCVTLASPCATINGAIDKAANGDMIKVAVGTYTGMGTEVVTINKNVTLSGGWDANFTAQNGMSTINGQSVRRAILINEGVTVSADRLIVYTGNANGGAIPSEGGGGILNKGNLSLDLSEIRSSGTSFDGGGIYNSGKLTITNSTIEQNSAFEFGGGIFNAGSLTLVNSLVIGNHTQVTGGGIENTGTAILDNNTLIGNQYGGIRNDGGTVILNNNTIFNNAGTTGGGIEIHFGSITLRNTIIADNFAISSGPDCWGPNVSEPGSIISAGYNIIKDISNCNFIQAIGDQTGVDPALGPLQDNGGPTRTFALLPGSPAIDAGNPLGCNSSTGLLTTDQRGFIRPHGAACDIGSYEYELASPPINFPATDNVPATTRPLFDWINVGTATSYTLQVSVNQNFTALVLNMNVTPSAYTMSTDLPRNTLLFWRVRTNGPGGPSAWSRVRHFSSANPPSVPVLVSPANAATVSPPPTLDWNDSSPAADYYEIQISTVSTFSTFLGRGFGGRAYQSNYIPQAALSPGTPYFWRVRAVNAAGQFSQWSAPRTFTTP
ncbi:MAG: hypothetical protein HYZ49_04960 [Chloroflexi bacterium]|nr:hypothetical protein [Chloroflexota bacterium]